MSQERYLIENIQVDTSYDGEAFTYSIEFSSESNSFYLIVSANEMRRHNVQKGAEPIFVKLSGFTYAPKLNNDILEFGEVNEFPIILKSQRLEVVDGKPTIAYKGGNLEALIGIEDELPEDLDFAKQYMIILYNHRLSLEQYEI